jgi:lipoprotein-releasing system permease protein
MPALVALTSLPVGADDLTRAYAAGAGTAALSVTLVALLLGAVRTSLGAALAPAIVLTVVGLAAAGLGAPEGAREGAWAFCGTAIGPAVFAAAGWGLGQRLDRRAAVVAMAGAFAWGLATWAFWLAAQRLFFEPEEIVAFVAAGGLLNAMIVGFAVAVAQRALALAEIGLITLVWAFAAFLTVALGPSEWLASVDAPAEQVLVALGLFPALASSAFFAVGVSLGFLLFGSGRFEPGFAYETQVALRYVRAHRRDGFVGVVTVIAVLGVCLGVMALIVVLSIMSGFENDLKRKILGAHAHMVVGKHGDDFIEYSAVEDQVRTVDEVESAAAFVLGDAMMSTDIGLSGTVVKGVDPSNVDAVAELRRNLRTGSVDYLSSPRRIPGACPSAGGRWTGPKSPAGASASGTSTATTGDSGSSRAGPRGLASGDPEVEPTGGAEACGRVLPGIIIGRELSRTLRAYVGDVVKLVSPVSEQIGPMGPMPKLRRFRVAGVFFSGMYEYDAKFSYLSMEDAQRFFGLHRQATGVEIKIDDIDHTSRAVESVRARLGGEPYHLRDWRDMNRELFSALLLEKIAMFVALAMIITVASFLIVATLVMIVLQRGKEIAILKSMGASDPSIMKIFVVQGLIVGVGGAILGVLGGIAVCLLLQTVGFPLDEHVFYIEKLPVVLDATEVTIIAVAAVTISYLATIYPAMTAAQLVPVDGLRDD